MNPKYACQQYRAIRLALKQVKKSKDVARIDRLERAISRLVEELQD